MLQEYEALKHWWKHCSTDPQHMLTITDTHKPKIFLNPRYIIKNTHCDVLGAWNLKKMCLFYSFISSFIHFFASRIEDHSNKFWVHKRSHTCVSCYKLWYEFLLLRNRHHFIPIIMELIYSLSCSLPFYRIHCPK